MDGFGHLHGMGQSISRGTVYQPQVVTVDLTQLQAGDVFKGEITAVNGQEVQLYLGQGQYLQARLEHDVQLALGQILNFQVQSSSAEKLILKPLYQNAYQQRVGEAALKAAHLPVNDKNLQLIAKMIENGLPIHKDSVGKVYRQMLSTPQASMEQIMQMNKMNLKVTPESFAQFQKYEGVQHSISAAIQDMADDVFKLYDALAQGNHVQGVGTEAANRIQTQTMMSGSSVVEQNGMQHNTEPQVQADIMGTNVQSVVGQNSADAVTFMEKVLQTINAGSDASAKASGETTNNPNNILGDILQSTPQQVADRVISGLQDGKLSMQDLETLLQSKRLQGEQGSEFVREVKEKLFASDTFRDKLLERMESQWSLTPDEIMEDKTQQFYKRLYQQSNELARLMNDASQTTTVQAGSAQNVQEGIEFMNQLNQIFQYVQLPLKLSDNHAHGELYVFTNKRNLAKRDGTLTALLHLDLEHLGNMDVHVALQLDTNQVITRFAVGEDVISLVETHMEELTQRLKGKGYTCHVSCEASEDTKSVIDYVEEQIAGTTVPLMYQAFDMRT